MNSYLSDRAFYIIPGKGIVFEGKSLVILCTIGFCWRPIQETVDRIVFIYIKTPVIGPKIRKRLQDVFKVIVEKRAGSL